MSNFLVETEHPLDTPSIIGTDTEKINVLGYWAGLISHLRSINMIVISHPNKLAIIDQLKKEIALIEAEVHNDTAHPVPSPDGAVTMEQPPHNDEVTANAPGEMVVDLTTSEEMKEKRIPISEQLQRLAGTWYHNQAKKKIK